MEQLLIRLPFVQSIISNITSILLVNTQLLVISNKLYIFFIYFGFYLLYIK